MWAPVGHQPEVCAPGQNQKKVVYGGVNYKTGKLIYTIADTKSGTKFLAFLVVLLAKYVGRKILLVCDNGRFHTTKAVRAWLDEHREQIEVYWLPPYSPTLNLIERLWGHIKRTVLANVLFVTLKDLTNAFKRGVRCLAGNPKRMAIMFDHEEMLHGLKGKSARKAA